MSIDIAWPFRPQMNVVESLEWLTDVHACKKAEYRRCLRPIPRIYCQCRYKLSAADYSSAREKSRTLAGLTSFLVPDWTTYEQIPTIGPATASIPFDATNVPAIRANAYVLIWESNSKYEYSQIASVGTGTITISPATTQSYTNPSIVPTRLGTFAQEFSADRLAHDDLTECSAVFEITDGEDLFALGDGTRIPSYTYRGDPLIPDPVELINQVQETDRREFEPLDSKTGQIYKYKIYATPNHSGALGWTARNADQLWDLRVWLHTRRGRWKQFWTSSWNNDLVITRNLNVGDATIEIAAIGFAGKYALPNDFAIVATDGGFWAFRVTAAAAGISGREVLTLSTPFTGTLPLSSISKTCKITLSRLDSDRIEIQHLPGRQATIAAPVKEIPVYP